MRQSLLKTRDLIHREKRLTFGKQIDLYSLEEGVVTGVTGALGKGFRFEGRDLLLQSESEMEDFEKRMRKFLNGLPQGLMLHFIVRAQSGDREILQAYSDSITDRNPLSEKLLASKINSYWEKPFLKREIFLFVVIDPTGSRRGGSFFPNLSLSFGKKAKRLSELEFAKSKEALFELSGEVKAGLADLGLNLLPLSDQEILRYLYEILNPSLAEVIPFENNIFKAKGDDSASLRSKLLFSPPIAGDRFFHLGRYFHGGLNLKDLPEETDLKVMKDFEKELGKEYLLSISFQAVDQDKAKGRIRRLGNYSKARLFFSKAKDHDAVKRVGESDELLTELAETGSKLFRYWFAVIVKDKDLNACEKRGHEILRAFPKLGGARGIDDYLNHDRLFLSALPLQGDDNPLPHTVTTEVLAHLLPLQASWKGTNEFGILFKTYREESLKLDLFDSSLAAKHAVMLGSTGSGKSFFTNHLLLYFLIQSRQHEVIVIDVGGSYKKLAQVFGGSYLEVECSETYALNPFPRKEVLFPEAEEADATFLQFLKELLQKLIGPSKIWSASEKMILEQAIRETYRTLKKEESPLLGDIEKVLRSFSSGDHEDKQKAYQFAKELVLFTEGEYGKILNRRGNFNVDSAFTVFDLRKISHYPELQEILLLIIPFALKRKFENIGIKKILVLDECWQLLKETQGTALVEVFYRTARKMNAGVLSISQNPEDFLDSKISGVMINNSSVKYILRLKKGHDKLAQFGLNENEIRAIEELEVKPGFYSETFVKFDDRAVILKLEPSALDYWIATTDPIDLVEETKIRESERNLNPFERLEKLANQFPNGVKKDGGLAHAA